MNTRRTRVTKLSKTCLDHFIPNNSVSIKLFLYQLATIIDLLLPLKPPEKHFKCKTLPWTILKTEQPVLIESLVIIFSNCVQAS